MRPRLISRGNQLSLVGSVANIPEHGASMRPRLISRGNDHLDVMGKGSLMSPFNEAPADQPGKLLQGPWMRQTWLACFNEAPADQPGKCSWCPADLISAYTIGTLQ
jgi:hypothetical protein